MHTNSTKMSYQSYKDGSPQENMLPEYQENNHPQKNKVRKVVFFLLKLSLTGYILFYIISRIQISSLKTEFTEISWTPLIIGMLLTIPNIYIQHMKWSYLLRIIKPGLSGREIFQSLMCGFAVGLITPGRLGELGRGLFIRSDNRSPMVGMAIIDKMLSLISLALISVFGLVFLYETNVTGYDIVEYVILVTAAGFIVLLATIFFYPDLLRKIIRLFKKTIYKLPFYKKVYALISASDNIRKQNVFAGLLYGLTFQSLIYIQFYWFLRSFTDAELVPVFILANLAMFLKSLLPIAVMDLGVREGAVIFFLNKIQINPAAAFNASLLLFLSNVLLPGMVGLYYIIRYHFKKQT